MADEADATAATDAAFDVAPELVGAASADPDPNPDPDGRPRVPDDTAL